MSQETHALMVYDLEDPVSALLPVLETQGIETSRAWNCEQARDRLESSQPLELVFTDTLLPDGTWSDVLALAHGSGRWAEVIVVSRHMDTGLYIDVLESHAFDLIVPPFKDSDLAHVVRCATSSSHSHCQAA